jgi:hypothetical protein
VKVFALTSFSLFAREGCLVVRDAPHANAQEPLKRKQSDVRSPLVQGRHHLPAPRQGLLRQRRRRHRRFSRPARSKLDYLQELGVTAIWLLPFYPSPLKDDGYDIADYFSVHPSYGTLEDFREFLDEAHQRACASSPSWCSTTPPTRTPGSSGPAARRPAPRARFLRLERQPRENTEARIIFKDFEHSNWTWDPVAKAILLAPLLLPSAGPQFRQPRRPRGLLKVPRFLAGYGRGRLRLDAVPYLYEREGTNCENLPRPTSSSKAPRAHRPASQPHAPGRGQPMAGGRRRLLRQRRRVPHEFPFPAHAAAVHGLQMEDRFPIIDILEQTPAIPEKLPVGHLPAQSRRADPRDGHRRGARLHVPHVRSDPRARINLGIRRRLAPLLGNNRRKIGADLNAPLFAARHAVIYYGDEIGMGDNFYLGDRNGVRTPMQWSPDRNAGFSRANPQQLYLPVIIDPEYHYESVNVENQQRNLSSLLWWTGGASPGDAVDGARVCRAGGVDQLSLAADRTGSAAIYVPTCRWFGENHRAIRELHIVQNVPIGSAADAARLLVIEVAFTEGLPQSYLLPVAFASASDTERLAGENPHSILALLEEQRALCDALYLPEVRGELLRLAATSGMGRGASPIHRGSGGRSRSGDSGARADQFQTGHHGAGEYLHHLRRNAVL